MAGPMMFSNGVSLKPSETVKGARDERAKSETGWIEQPKEHNKEFPDWTLELPYSNVENRQFDRQLSLEANLDPVSS